MKRTSYFLRLWALCLALLLLSGCAGPEGSGTAASTVTVPQDTVPATSSAETTEPSVTASSADSGSFGLSYYPDAGFNPFSCTKLANRAIMSLVYQRLFIVTDSYEAEPELCREYSFSDDLRTCTITLNSATFSNGEALTAEDVVASIQAAQDSDVYGTRFFHMASIQATGASTLTITMDTPYEMLPMLLDVPIVRAEEVDSSSPIGSGPYMLQSSGSSMSLKLRSDWAGSLPVSQDAIPLYAATSTTQIRDSFEFGYTDVSYTDPGSASYVDYRCDYELYDCPTGIMLYLACNSNSGVFADKSLRAALTYAIDRDALLADPYNGFARSATLPADPGSPFYDSTLAAEYDYEPERFASIVEEKALIGTPITLLVDGNNSYRVTAAKKIAGFLTDAGLTVKISSLSGSDYYNALSAWNFDLHLGETRLSPNFDLSQFFRPWGDLAYAGMSDSDLYDACLDALENSGNYYNLHRAIMADGALCPVLFRTYAVYVNRGAADGLSPAMDCILHIDPPVSEIQAEEESSEPTAAAPSESEVSG